MKTLNIYSSKENIYIDYLKDKYDISRLDNQNFLKKIFGGSKKCDVYFCESQNSIDEEVLNSSKKVIVSSNRLKDELCDFYDIKEENILVLYPTFKPQTLNHLESKKALLNEMNIEDNDTKVIFFNAKNLKKSGAIEFIEIITKITPKNYIAIIAGEKKQVTSLKFQISKYINMPNLFLVEDFENIDLFFSACDIFIMPTTLKTFNVEVLKASYYNSAVLVSINNDSSEILDTFSKMDGAHDGSTPFKLDALILNDNDLENVKEENKKITSEYEYKKQIDRLERFINLV